MGQRFDEGGFQALWKDPNGPGGWNAFGDDLIKELEVDIEVLEAEIFDIEGREAELFDMEGRDMIKSDDDLEEEMKTSFYITGEIRVSDGCSQESGAS